MLLLLTYLALLNGARGLWKRVAMATSVLSRLDLKITRDWCCSVASLLIIPLVHMPCRMWCGPPVYRKWWLLFKFNAL